MPNPYGSLGRSEAYGRGRPTSDDHSGRKRRAKSAKSPRRHRAPHGFSRICRRPSAHQTSNRTTAPSTGRSPLCDRQAPDPVERPSQSG